MDFNNFEITATTTSVESSITFSSILYQSNFLSKNIKKSNISNAFKLLKNQYNILKKI